MATVTNAEVDKAFYDSYKDSGGKLDPALVDRVSGKPRKLTADPADSKFRDEWIKIRKHLQEVKNCPPLGGGGKVGGVVAACAKAPKDPDAPPLDLDKWNKDPAVTGSTNCYAYAMDSSKGHVVDQTPQPGLQSGSSPKAWTCKAYSDSVLADGNANGPDTILSAPQCPYQKQNNIPPPKKSGYYMVALVMTPNSTDYYDAGAKEFRQADYHWFRQDDNGLWSQKQGQMPAKNTDEKGNLITNPQTCSQKETTGTHFQPGVGNVPAVLDYSSFCGYFYVKKGGANVKG